MSARIPYTGIGKLSGAKLTAERAEPSCAYPFRHVIIRNEGGKILRREHLSPAETETFFLNIQKGTP